MEISYTVCKVLVNVMLLTIDKRKTKIAHLVNVSVISWSVVFMVGTLVTQYGRQTLNNGILLWNEM